MSVMARIDRTEPQEFPKEFFGVKTNLLVGVSTVVDQFRNPLIKHASVITIVPNWQDKPAIVSSGKFKLMVELHFSKLGPEPDVYADILRTLTHELGDISKNPMFAPSNDRITFEFPYAESEPRNAYHAQRFHERAVHILLNF